MLADTYSHFAESAGDEQRAFSLMWGPVEMDGRKHVAIIGGGSIATSFVNHLVRQLIGSPGLPSPRITVFEPRSSPGAGGAYMNDLPCVLLNTQAATMSAIHGNPMHFLQWLHAHEWEWRPLYPDLEVTEHSYVPRSLFGKYLEALFEDTQTAAKRHGIEIEHVAEQVIDLIPGTEGGRHVVVAGKPVPADVIVMAIGNFTVDSFQHLEGCPGYFSSVYPGRKLSASVPKHESVVVLGANLSAIDAIVSLSEAGRQGKIACVSRRGRFPSVRGTLNKKHQLKYFTREALAVMALHNGGSISLDDIWGLLTRELQQAEGQPGEIESILRPGLGAHDYLATEIDDSMSTARTWQSIIYATNSVIDLAWHKLSGADKRRFFERFRSAWLSYRVSFPMENARKLRELMRRDMLAVHGGLAGVEYDASARRFKVMLDDEKRSFQSILLTRYVVNASGGSSMDVTKCPLPIVRNMLRRQVGVPSEFGGFAVDFDTGRLLMPDRSTHGSIYVLGALSSGTYFWTNAMDVNARLAHGQATRVVKQLGEACRAQNELAGGAELSPPGSRESAVPQPERFISPRLSPYPAGVPAPAASSAPG